MSTEEINSEVERHQRITHISLDERSVVRQKPEVEHERAVAIFDLMEENVFALTDHPEHGPFHLHLRLEDGRLTFDVRHEDGQSLSEIILPLAPFRAVMRDYFLICESYFEAIRRSTPAQVEAIDVGRRSLHNEGSLQLQERLKGRIEVDHNTARRLFTLLYVLQLRG